MNSLIKVSTMLVCLMPAALLANPVVEQLLKDYSQQASVQADAVKGKLLWTTAVTQTGSDEQRNCTRCHGDRLSSDGRHATTGKAIKPMSPAVNATRFTDALKIEKWFKRNCKWTWGRECTADEKASFLLYLTTGTE